jgi:hypothetical protein
MTRFPIFDKDLRFDLKLITSILDIRLIFDIGHLIIKILVLDKNHLILIDSPTNPTYYDKGLINLMINLAGS